MTAKNSTEEARYEGAVSAVYIRVRTDKISPEAVAEILGYPSSSPYVAKARFPTAWWGQTRWRLGDDVGKTLDDFLSHGYLKLREGLKRLRDEYGAEVEIQLVIGIEDSIEHGIYPITHISPSAVKTLADDGFGFQIHIDSQLGKESVGL